MAKSLNKLTRREIHYLDGVNTLVGDNIAKITELSHCENARSNTIGTIEKRKGTRRLGDDISVVENYSLFYFKNTGTNGMYRISKVGSTVNIYYLNGSGVWTSLALGGFTITGIPMSQTFALGRCFLVNGTDQARIIEPDGTTVGRGSSQSTQGMAESPIGKLINYYKERLYIGDITISGVRRRGLIQRSSYPLGIVTLVDGDHAAGVGTVNVVDTKYLPPASNVDIYRAGTKIETIGVGALANYTATSFDINAATTSNILKSSDEVWLANTATTEPRRFAWTTAKSMGDKLKEYDTFIFPGNQDDDLTMMTNVGDVMMIASANNMAAWNDYSLQNFDVDIGCTSKNGFALANGALWFVHYSGIYSTSGGLPRLMSSKIQKYIDGATKAGLDAAAVGKKGFSIFFAIGDVTLYNGDGSTYKTLSDVVLEYNVQQENWYVHTNIPAENFVTYIHSTDPDRLEYTENSGDLNIVELFNTEQEDTDTEIPFRIDTANITLSKEFENNVYVHKVIIETERGSGITCFVSLDKENFYPIEGEIEKGCTILQVTGKDKEKAQPPKCRQFKLSLRDYTKKICKISRIAILYSDTLQEYQK